MCGLASSTHELQPNKVGLKCPSAHPYVRPQKVFFDFTEIWYVGRGRRLMHDGMQYELIQGQGHEPLKVRKSAIIGVRADFLGGGAESILPEKSGAIWQFFRPKNCQIARKNHFARPWGAAAPRLIRLCLPFSKAISSPIYNGDWQMTTDS